MMELMESAADIKNLDSRLDWGRNRKISWSVVGYVTIIHIGAAFAFLPAMFSWSALGTAIVLHIFSGCFGLSIGLHRLVTHRTISVPKWFEHILVAFTALEAQRPISWIAIHRMHHAFEGTNFDPHDRSKGFMWSHMGWFLRVKPDGWEPYNLVPPEIADDKFYRFLEKQFLVVPIITFIVLFSIGGAPFLVWAGFVRMVYVGHMSWFINSICHRVNKTTRSHISTSSKNTGWLSLLTFGESYHNNHHGKPYRAKLSHRWWEIDVSSIFISLFRLIWRRKNVGEP